MSQRSPLIFLSIVVCVSGLYLYALPTPTVYYAGIVLLHVILGVVATVLLLKRMLPEFREWSAAGRVASLLGLAGAALGVALIFTGTARAQWNWLYLHMAASFLAVSVLLALWLGKKKWPGMRGAVAATGISFLAVGLAVAGAVELRAGRWAREQKIQNPALPPASMDGEGDGPRGDFFPSSSQTMDGKRIPGRFFMESKACERCHADAYKQWNSSAHHFSSFNNQWYRKSVEYMQEVVGTRPSKWCGGCHDPAVLYSGMMDTPIRQIMERPETQAGLGCVMCHSIAKVKSTMGQGDFYLEYPQLHDLAASENPVVRAMHDFVIKLNPEPHRRVFLKPFMRMQTPEFCSSCHKVHLDMPVNHYRWVRGFNEYDNWQASGVSGQGARSFYYPAKPMGCADCHMPLVPSKDSGNQNGFIHSHSFPGANTALPTANQDAAQLELTERFLMENAVSVDIFGVSAAAPMTSAETPQAEMATTFAVGEEAETKVAMGAAGASSAPNAALTAPLNRTNARLRRGDTVRVDVVVRTRKVGHFFPGGTVDAYDTWLEFKATDDRGQVLFWSGMVEDGGRGPVDKGAHFYRSLLIDEHGNPINKRNAWANRAVVYVRLIPPGAADTVHYRLHIPENAGDHIKLEARLCYRKFSWWNTQFSFAGVPETKQGASQSNSQDPVQRTPDYDDTKYVFTGDTSGVSGKVKQIPDLPIVVMARDEVTLHVDPKGGKAPGVQLVFAPEDWTRWNDYGIGLLLQGDLRGAAATFQMITDADAKNADGWVNQGRAAVQEGDMQRARQVLERALALKPELAAANFFYAKVLRNDGEYDEAAKHLRVVLSEYPRDRVARGDLGRTLFLQKRYGDAVAELQKVLEIDPEDLQAHYNLMLCYQGMGREELARQHQRLYLRFKADEASQALTGNYRRLHPEDNNERQSIHEHGSVPLAAEKHTARNGHATSVGQETKLNANN